MNLRYGGARDSVSGRAVIYGLTSFGGKDDRSGYTDVYYYLDWIKNIMDNN